MVYSTRRFVLCLTLRYLFLSVSVPLALRLSRLGKRGLILVLVCRRNLENRDLYFLSVMCSLFPKAIFYIFIALKMKSDSHMPNILSSSMIYDSSSLNLENI